MTSHDPLERYGALMNKQTAPAHLPDKVLKRAEETAPTHLADSVPERAARAPQRSAIPKRRPFKPFALAACLLLALGMGIALVLPLAAPDASSSSVPPFTSRFAVKAYAASSNSIIFAEEGDSLTFECDMLGMTPSQERYEEEGFYSGCMFSIEGEDITRIQAHIDRGELYRYTYEEFVRSSDPDRWAEALSHKPTEIGEGERFAEYDLVQPTLGDDGKDRNDPDKLVAVKCYQRLGSTIDTDTDVLREEGADLSSYRFGFWNNDVNFAYGSSDQPTLFNSIDSLNGAQVTITVTFEDGSCQTKVIELKAADLEAHQITAQDGSIKGVSLTGESGGDPLASTDSSSNIMTMHTLEGAVVEVSDEPFPCGEASHPTLDEPLTGRHVIEGHNDSSAAA